RAVERVALRVEEELVRLHPHVQELRAVAGERGRVRRGRARRQRLHVAVVVDGDQACSGGIVDEAEEFAARGNPRRRGGADVYDVVAPATVNGRAVDAPS